MTTTNDTTDTTETGPNGEPIPTGDDGLPLVYYDEDGNAKPGVVRVDIRARVAVDWEPQSAESPDYRDLQRRIAEAFLAAADADAGGDLAGHDDDDVVFLGHEGENWSFPNDAVVAYGDASVAQDADREDRGAGADR